MNAVQWVGVVLVLAGVGWIYLHPKETGVGEVGFKGLSAKGLTQGGLLAALGVVLVLVPVLTNDPPPSPGRQPTVVSSSSCRVSGTVYDRDTKGPFPDVDVGFVPSGATFTDEERFVAGATTDPQGRFSFDCDGMLSDGQVVTLALSHVGWGDCLYVTGRTLYGPRLDDGVTIYVSDATQRALGVLFGVPKNPNCERTV
jgi:hypothetical protein